MPGKAPTRDMGRYAAALWLALAAHRCLAQTPPTSNPPSYRIAGRIVSAADGRPLPGAKVLLQNDQLAALATSVADEQGRFAFSNVTAGLHPLQGEAPGYVTAAYLAHGIWSTAIITGAGVDTESLLFKLAPLATLSGRVTDEAGDPVRNAAIALYQEDRNPGLSFVNHAGSAQTNDHGEYEFGQLTPGRYFVSASGTPWYAVHPQPAPPRQYPAGIVDSVDPALNVAYPITFYPGVAEAAAAAPVTLRGGEVAVADIHLYPLPAMTITIQRPPGDKNNQIPQLQQSAFTGLEHVNAEVLPSPTAYTISGVAPGQYSLTLTAAQPGEPARAATIDLTRGNTQLDAEFGEKLAQVRVLLKAADGAKFPPQTRVDLIPSTLVTSLQVFANEKGEAQFDGVRPGVYTLDAIAVGQHNYYVTGLSVGGEYAKDKQLHVATAAMLSVTLTVQRGNFRVEGYARRDSNPVVGAMVLLADPNELGNLHFDGWRDQTNLDGSFQLNEIPPGKYVLLAIDDGWDLAWRNHDVLARYLPLAVPVVVPESGDPSIRLADPLLVQPR